MHSTYTRSLGQTRKFCHCWNIYHLTSRLSQDKLENLLGIIRQPSGSNDHPSPDQFLVTINCFYNLARAPKSGNRQAEMARSMLTSPSMTNDAVFSIQDIIEDMLEFGDVGVIRSALDSDHRSYVVEARHDRLCGKEV